MVESDLELPGGIHVEEETGQAMIGHSNETAGNDAPQTFRVRGRVRLADGTGIPGLTVDVTDPNDRFYDLLGSTVTNGAGRFNMEYEPGELPQLFVAAPEISLSVRDLQGLTLHRSATGRSSAPGREVIVDIVVEDDHVVRHLDEVQVLRPSSDSPVPAEHVETIAEAWEAVATTLGDMRPFSTSWALCPGPPLLEAVGLVDTAMGVLDGDPMAYQEFAGTLDLMASRASDLPDSGHPSEQPHAASLDDAYLSGLHSQIEQRLVGAETMSPVPHHEFVALATAAVISSGGDERVMHRRVGILLDQICGLTRFGRTLAAAEAVRFGALGAMDRFQREWEGFIGDCGPDDGPLPPFPGPGPQPDPHPCPSPWPPGPRGLPDDPAVLEKWACTAEAVLAFRRVRAGGTYTITSISNPRACPGETITITGSNFGTAPGEVRFQKGVGAIDVAAVSWSSTSVTVTVPDEATCGPISLRIFEETVEVCGLFIDIYRNARAVTRFEGGATHVKSLRVGGPGGSDCALPGEGLRVSWDACNTDEVTLEVRDSMGRFVRPSESVAATDSTVVTLPSYTSTTEVTFSISVTGPCGSDVRTRAVTVQRPYRLSVEGMEVTQAIQYYNAAAHLTDPSDRGPDNSLQLVTNKTAWVRVYLRSGQDASFEGGRLPDVDGTLTVERRTSGEWSTVGTINSQNGPITVPDSYPNYRAERSNSNATLNFIVPAGWMTGLLRMTVNTSSPFVVCGDGTDRSMVTVDVNLTQTLNAAFITIGYQGTNAARTGTLDLDPPTLGQCQTETGWAMRTYPVSGAANVRVAGTFVTNTPLDDARTAPGACSPNWRPLLQNVANLVAADQAANPGTNWVYYGIINAGIPVNVPGCNGWGATGGLATTPPREPIRYAHEIGHQFGLAHAPCGNVGAPNPAYPPYEPYDLPLNPPGTANWTMASIGEYGLDIDDGNIFDPNTDEDFMSYCGPRWVSVFTHQFLANAAGLAPQTIATGAGRYDEGAMGEQFEPDRGSIRPLIHMMGQIDEKGSVEVTTVARLETLDEVGDGQQSEYVAQLLDEDGQVLSETPVFTYPFLGQEPGEATGEQRSDDVMFKALLADHGLGATLRIVKSGEQVWRRDRPETPIGLSEAEAELGDDDSVRIRWEFESEPDDTPEVWLRWSDDGGERWHALTVGVFEQEVSVELEQIAASGEVSFQIMAHDGFSTETIQTDPIGIPEREPVVTILHPSPGRPTQGAWLHLWGVATSRVSDELDDEDFTWVVDDRVVGHGRDIWVEDPGPKARTVRLDVRDRAGVGSASVQLRPDDQTSD